MAKTKQVPSRYIEKGGMRALPHNLRTDYKRNRIIYWLALPILAWFIIFSYLPMFGIAMAFQDFSPAKGVFGSDWAGFRHFADLFGSPYFGRILRNTVVLGFLDLLVGFPAPMVFALLLNEITSRKFKRVVQTISYMPYFISSVVVCGLLVDFTSTNGVVSGVVASLTGAPPQNLLANPGNFRTIFVASNVWQGLGYGSIIYISALSSVDQELYEAAVIDGAGRLKQIWRITLPGIMPTIVMMLILRTSTLLAVSTDKILLLYSTATYETADVIGTYVYRVGLIDQNYGFSTAVGLFNSVVATALLLLANGLSRRFSETSLF